jgi:hypothetical protein
LRALRERHRRKRWIAVLHALVDQRLQLERKCIRDGAADGYVMAVGCGGDDQMGCRPGVALGGRGDAAAGISAPHGVDLDLHEVCVGGHGGW